MTDKPIQVRRAKFEVTFYIAAGSAPFIDMWKVETVCAYRTQGRSSVKVSGRSHMGVRSRRYDFDVAKMPKWLTDLLKENLSDIELLWLSGWHRADITKEQAKLEPPEGTG
jgi:hypothetical protein